jgi:hypothetical protein
MRFARWADVGDRGPGHRSTPASTSAPDVDKGKPKIDWNLVYDHDSVVDPVANPSLWNAVVFDRKERRLRSDELIAKTVGLRCVSGGTVRRGPSDPDVFGDQLSAVYSGG